MGKTKKLPIFPKPQSDNLFITNSQWVIPISLSSVKQVATFLLKDCKEKIMALHFVGEKKISTLHNLYFDDPTVTDCITFPYEDPLFLGEVYLCPQLALRYVKKHGGDLYKELTLYLVHGYLHLMGMEDQTLEGKREMRLNEEKWMKALAKKNLMVKPK